MSGCDDFWVQILEMWSNIVVGFISVRDCFKKVKFVK